MRLLLWEGWTYIQIPVNWWLFRRFARRDIMGDVIAGTFIGAMFEFITEPLWDYHFHITIYKDVPFSIPFAWGLMFTLVVFVSEKLYNFVLRRQSILPGDKRIFIFDVIGGLMVGLPMEWIGLNQGIWNYRYDHLNIQWGIVPILNMPYEVLAGYALLMLTTPTFVRYWQGAFEGRTT